MAGTLAERLSVGLIILTIEPAIVDAVALPATDEIYLKGFHLLWGKAVKIAGEVEYQQRIVAISESEHAGMTVIGSEPYEFWEHLL